MLHRFQFKNFSLNRNLEQGFHLHENAQDVRKSHHFGGRYENIYLTVNHIPELNDLLKLVIEQAKKITGSKHLHYGYWFNAMPPGSSTTLHNHDNNDELLSCVYYVRVPQNSGDIIIYENDKPLRITPSEGELICFPPQIDHEVTENLSDACRLSIAINFGATKHDKAY